MSTNIQASTGMQNIIEFLNSWEAYSLVVEG